MLEALFVSDTPYYITRWIFQRALGGIYFIGFLIALNQGRGLIGENGILPAKDLLPQIGFWEAPSLFHLHISDRFMMTAAALGLALSAAAIAGLTDAFSNWVSALCWFTLWALYMSFVNIGSVFYGFGWESLLLETGFLAIFFGASSSPPSLLVIWLLRWLLFRLMFGAGLIKLRGDECWRDLTCLIYHYETQPLPGPLSWYFHNAPVWLHKAGVVFNHFVELIVPFGFFAPGRIRTAAGLLTVIFQSTLIASGNLSWLNCITIVIAVACFDDHFWRALIPGTDRLPFLITEPAIAAMPVYIYWGLGFLIVTLSIRPAWNLISETQLMNASFEPFHLVNTYGAFGSITKQRFEVILEGTRDKVISPATEWREYHFKGKPGDVGRMPPQFTPYHYKLDWQMWFAAMSSYRYHPWIVPLIERMLRNQPEVMSLFAVNPFEGEPPARIRARLYLYKFAPASSNDWWTRTLQGEYLPPISLSDFKRD